MKFLDDIYDENWNPIWLEVVDWFPVSVPTEYGYYGA